MTGFESPNYTQTPNDLFDSLMKGMSEAELKVTLAVIRGTFGYHRTAFKMSLAKLAKLTGLSENGAIAGAEAAEKRGTIKRIIEGKRSTIWVAITETTSPSEVELPHPVRQFGETTSPSEEQLGLKKAIKDNKDKRAHDARLDHPSMQVYRGNTSLYVPVNWRDEVIATVTDYEKWGGVIRDWMGKGWNKGNVKGMLDVYKNGISTNGRRPSPPPTKRKPPEQSAAEVAAILLAGRAQP